jgi:DNA-binding CsgD family transcriptional regulator
MKIIRRKVPCFVLMAVIAIGTFLFYGCQKRSPSQKALFTQLDALIKKDTEALAEKNNTIKTLQLAMNNALQTGMQDSILHLSLNLARVYENYVYDSAFYYYRQVLDLSAQQQRDSIYNYSKFRLGRLLSSVGLYSEAIDSLRTIDLSLLDSSYLVKYYEQLTYTYYDLADFQDDNFFAPGNRIIASAYVDSTIQAGPSNSGEVLGVKAFRFLATQQVDSAEIYYQRILDNPKMEAVHRAMAHAVLGFIHLNDARIESGQDHLINSAIIDYQTGIKGGISLIVLADHLYKADQNHIAYQYIKKARRDAEIFGSRMRRLHASDVYAKIEQSVLFSETRKRQVLTKFLIGITLLIIALTFFSIVLFRHIFSMKKIHSIIRRNYLETKSINIQLQESNKIKERYIGYFLRMNAKYIEKLVSIVASLNKLIINHNTDKIESLLNNIKPKEERDHLLKSFDQIFLSIFPNFISDIKNLLRPEEELVIKKGQLLNNELRVFALVRIGVDESESIAEILNISVNTVYSYKAKFKNKTNLSSEEFDDRVMQIRAGTGQ